MSGSGRKLYWASGSLFAWRAMITLEEKALPYEAHAVSLSQGEHKSDWYTAEMNPRGQVPTFRDGDDVAIHESGAICEYLEAAYGSSGTKLMPEDPKLRAQVYGFMWESANVVPVFRPLAFDEGTDEQRAAMRVELGHWERHFEGKTFLVGDAFSLADVLVWPLVAALHRFGLDFDEAGLPHLAQYYEGLRSRPSIQKTWPPHWKEGPGNGRLANVYRG